MSNELNQCLFVLNSVLNNSQVEINKRLSEGKISTALATQKKEFLKIIYDFRNLATKEIKNLNIQVDTFTQLPHFNSAAESTRFNRTGRIKHYHKEDVRAESISRASNSQPNMF